MSKNLENLLSLAKALESPFFVGLVVMNERGEILLGKRREDDKWTGPGGGADMGENPRDTAGRELFEETGLILSNGSIEPLCELRSKDKRPIYCFLVRMPSMSELTLQNDPDKEVHSWGWFPLLGTLPEIKDPNRARAILEAKLKVLGIKKSIVMNEDLPGYDLNTAEYSMDKLTADSPRIKAILELMEGFDYGELPREMILPNGYKMSLVKVDDGVFSGYVRRDANDPIDANETALRIQKMPAPSIVQALEAKGYYGLPEAQPEAPQSIAPAVEAIVEQHEAQWEGQEGTPAEQAADAAAFEQIEEMVESEAPQSEDLKNLLGMLTGEFKGDIHIHLAKAKKPIGTISNWGGIQYKKVSDTGKPEDWQQIPQNKTPEQHEAEKKQAVKEAVDATHSEYKAKEMEVKQKETDKKLDELHAKADKISEVQAAEMGRKAFKAGKKAVPAHDSNFMSQLKDRKVGTSDKLLAAWLKGFHEANSQASVTQSESKKKIQKPSVTETQAKIDTPEKLKAELEDTVKDIEAAKKDSKPKTHEEVKELATKMSQKDFVQAYLDFQQNQIVEKYGYTHERAADYVKSKKRAISATARAFHESRIKNWVENGLKPSPEALADYPGLGGSDTLPEGMEPELNEQTNLVKAFDFGRTPKKVQKEFAELTNDCNKVLVDMGIKFKTPLTFKAQNIKATGKKTRGEYSDSEKAIYLKDESQASKTVMHEIGHALDYAMVEKVGRGRMEEVTKLADSPNQKLKMAHSRLYNLITNSDYYTDPEIGIDFRLYLNRPTEIFARAFEVYSLVKAEKLVEKGKVSPKFIETFLPDVFKTRNPEVETLKKQYREIPNTPENLPKRMEIRDKINSVIETTGGWMAVPEDQQKEYKTKISALMEEILASDEIRKAIAEIDLFWGSGLMELGE